MRHVIGIGRLAQLVVGGLFLAVVALICAVPVGIEWWAAFTRERS